MSRSANALFHYTKSIDNLNGIIENGFEHRHVQEDLPLRGFRESFFSKFPGVIEYRFGWELVCFCDIPLSNIGDHIDQYGKYCIAMEKEWGISRGVTPVRYVHYDTPDLQDDKFMLSFMNKISRIEGAYNMIHMIARMLTDAKEIDGFGQNDFDVLPEKIQRILHHLDIELSGLLELIFLSGGYLRTYKGKWRDRRTGEMCEKLFYEEREWRSLKRNRDQTNLMFKLSDIKALFVQTEDERRSIFDALMNKGDQLEITDENQARHKIFLVDPLLEIV